MEDRNFTLVMQELHTFGWRHADSQLVKRQVLGCASNTGESVYRYTLPIDSQSAWPDVVVKGREGFSHSLAERKLDSAASVMSAAGVSPARIVSHDKFTIEEYSGQTLKEWFDILHSEKLEVFLNAADGPAKESLFKTLCQDIDWAARNLGSLAARIHMIPPDWFKPYQQEFILANPQFSAVPSNSFLWPLVSLHGIFEQREFLQALTAEQLVELSAAYPHPISDLNLRYVTCHNDFWLGNITQRDEKLWVIDLDWTTPSPAVMTWAHFQTMYFGPGNIDKPYCLGSEFCEELVKHQLPRNYFQRALFEGYLQELGEPPSTEAVDQLLFDGVCWCPFLQAPFVNKMILDEGLGFSTSVDYLKAFGNKLKEVWQCEESRQQVIDNGIATGCPSLAEFEEFRQSLMRQN